MSQSMKRGVAEMTAAMTISGTIGLFVVLSQQPLANVVFWRCAIGAATLLAICATLGLLRPGTITMRQFALAALGGVAIVSNWLFLFAAYPLASISIATAVYNTQPFMLVALGVLVVGERPGLSSPDSLGLYLTLDPRIGRSDAERNCISNVRPAGLSHDLAAFKLDWLLTQAFALGISGVNLKDGSGPALAAAPSHTALADGSAP